MISFQNPMNNLRNQESKPYLDNRGDYFQIKNNSNMLSSMEPNGDTFSKRRFKNIINYQVKSSSFNNNQPNSYATSNQAYMNNSMNIQSSYPPTNSQHQQYCQDNNFYPFTMDSMRPPNDQFSNLHSTQSLKNSVNNPYQYQNSYGVYSVKNINDTEDSKIKIRNKFQIPEANKIISTDLTKKVFEDVEAEEIPTVNDRIASLCRNAKVESNKITRSSLRFPRRAVSSLRYSSNSRILPDHNENASKQMGMNKTSCNHSNGDFYHCPNCLCFQDNPGILKQQFRSRSSQRPESIPKNSYYLNETQPMNKTMSQSISLNDINCTGIQAQLSVDDFKDGMQKGWLLNNPRQFNNSQGAQVNINQLYQNNSIEDGFKNGDHQRNEEQFDSEVDADLLKACNLVPGDFLNLIGMEENASKDDGSIYLKKKDMEVVIKLAKRALIVGKQDTEVAASLKRGLDIHFGRAWHVVAGLGPYGSHVASVQGALAHFRLHGWAFLVWQTPDE